MKAQTFSNQSLRFILLCTFALGLYGFSVAQMSVISMESGSDSLVSAGTPFDDQIINDLIGNSDLTTSENQVFSFSGGSTDAADTNHTSVTINGSSVSESVIQTTSLSNSVNSLEFNASLAQDTGGLNSYYFTVGANGNYLAESSMVVGNWSEVLQNEAMAMENLSLFDETTQQYLYNINASFYLGGTQNSLNAMYSLKAGDRYVVIATFLDQVGETGISPANAELGLDVTGTFSLQAQAAPEPDVALLCIPILGAVVLRHRLR